MQNSGLIRPKKKKKGGQILSVVGTIRTHAGVTSRGNKQTANHKSTRERAKANLPFVSQITWAHNYF